MPNDKQVSNVPRGDTRHMNRVGDQVSISTKAVCPTCGLKFPYTAVVPVGQEQGFQMTITCPLCRTVAPVDQRGKAVGPGKKNDANV